jgi:hemolysin activation/secretion protein
MFSAARWARLCVALLFLSPLTFAHGAPTPGETDLIRELEK